MKTYWQGLRSCNDNPHLPPGHPMMEGKLIQKSKTSECSRSVIYCICDYDDMTWVATFGKQASANPRVRPAALTIR